jgi:hypothetical protein
MKYVTVHNTVHCSHPYCWQLQFQILQLNNSAYGIFTQINMSNYTRHFHYWHTILQLKLNLGRILVTARSTRLPWSKRWLSDLQLWENFTKQRYKQTSLSFRKYVVLSTDRLHWNWSNYVIIALIQICLAGTYKVPSNTCKTCCLGRVAFELRVRKLTAVLVQSCQGGDWRLDLLKFPMKHRIASARQCNTAL